ncbi:MAG: SIS domain-containing protein [Clostridia bacterium]|nr:SIS domain-containing protein [Clostridia bacterium]
MLEGCREQIMQAYELLRDCYMAGGKVLVGGNGGSCADSEHIVGELMKGFYLKRPVAEGRKARLAERMDAILPGASELMQQGLPAIALTGHASLSTAVINDTDPLLTMAQQVISLGKPEDVVIGISTSGNARNAALAVQCGKALGLKTIGLAGGKGGRLKDICDCAIVVPGNCPADVQELHLPVYHTLCAMIEAKFFDE